MEIERRALSEAVELRATLGAPSTLAGYAALFDQVSEDLGGFREVLRPGCFDGLLEGDVLCRAEHDSSMLLGRTTSGTLRLRLDAKGLRYEVDLPETSAGRDVAALAGRGDLRGSSFAFTVNQAGQKWSTMADGTPLRELVKLTSLRDVAPVAEPAYAETTVSARSLEEARRIAPQADLAVNLSGRPWAILEDIAEHVHGLVDGAQAVTLRSLAALRSKIHAYRDDDEDDEEQGQRVEDGVAIIPVIGTMTQRGGISGTSRSTAAIADEVRAAALDPAVRAIVMEFDTPGGEVFGVPEAWEEIRAAAQAKPVVAHANSFAASAGYYLFSAACEGWVAPSGQVGSVGVYMLHVDRSRQLENQGVKFTYIKAGRHKAEGNQQTPLSPEAKEALQLHVNRYYDTFVGHVAQGRGVTPEAVRGGFGEGRMVLAQDAVAQRMADRIGTLAQAIERARELADARALPGVPLEIMQKANDLARI